MKLVDSHTHLFDMKKTYSLPPDIYPVVVGYSHTSNKKAVDMSKKHGYPIVLGIAPQTTIKEGIKDIEKWIEFIRNNRPNAIGEVGLDYKWAENKKHVEGERYVFSRMIELARELDLPVVIHSRNNPNDNDLPKDAVAEIISMTKGTKFLMHFYSGTEIQAQEIVDNGGYISVTSMRSKERKKVINTVPLDRLLVESDSPYIGRTPETIRDAIAYIAEVRGVDVELVAKATAENAMKFFNFKL
jgi:TatD DNase family protein